MQRIILKFDDVGESSFTPAHVRTATIVPLPFHLCTGALFQVSDPEDKRLQIWLRNKISVPHTADIHEEARVQMRGSKGEVSAEDFQTIAVIVDSQPDLDSGVLQAIKGGSSTGIGWASLSNPGFRLLNEVIGAHQMVRLGPYISYLGAAWPSMLTEREIIDRIVVEAVVIVNPECAIDGDMVLNMLAQLERMPFGRIQRGVGEIRDFSSEQLNGLVSAVGKIRNHAFYELKTNAIAAMLRGDSIVAVVLGCAALEGAHGAFLRVVLRDKVPNDGKKFNQFMDTLLREQGFYSLVQMSARVLMKEEERPNEETLEKCLRGVTMRNAIMHAGIKGTGKYKIRELSRSELNDGYSGIMAMYRAFEAALEGRETDRGQ